MVLDAFFLLTAVDALRASSTRLSKIATQNILKYYIIYFN